MVGKLFKRWSRPVSSSSGNTTLPPWSESGSKTNGSVAVPPADLPKPRYKGQKVKPEEIRELCNLVRKRYAVDGDLWDLRHAKDRDRSKVWERIDKAEATLAKIRRILASWDSPELFSSAEEWEQFQDIKARIHLDNKRDWIANPPWSGE
jgi:hypothetical protein